METGEASRATGASVEGGGADLRELTSAAITFVRAWSELLQAEFALAARNLRAIAITALFIPLLCTGIWLSLLALALGALHELGLSWLAAGAVDCLLQIAIGWTLVQSLRRWSRDLVPHRARNMLMQLVSAKP